MNNNTLKIVKMIIPDKVIVQISEQSKVNLIKTQNICIEIITRTFNDDNMDKKYVSQKLKNIISKSELRKLLKNLNEKYNINTTEASAVLSLLIPIIFKRLNYLDSINNQNNNNVEYNRFNTINQSNSLSNSNVANNRQNVSQDFNYDSVFRNIEMQARKDDTLNFGKSELNKYNHNDLGHSNSNHVTSSSYSSSEKINKICIYIIVTIFSIFVILSLVLLFKQMF